MPMRHGPGVTIYAIHKDWEGEEELQWLRRDEFG